MVKKVEYILDMIIRVAVVCFTCMIAGSMFMAVFMMFKHLFMLTFEIQ